MKNKLMVFSLITLAILNIFVSFYAINIKEKYESLKILDSKREDRLDSVTLKLNESAKINLGTNQYTLKLLKIIKDPPCFTTGFDSTDCVRTGEYDINFSINGITFTLDSGLNYSHPIITTNFRTDYIIYYVPEYNDEEATFFIEKDKSYKKETNLIVGNYIVYVDENNKVIDITTFTREVETWGKKYAGKNLTEIRELINKGEDLKIHSTNSDS